MNIPKRKVHSSIRTILLLIGVLIIAALFRIIWLDRVPPAIGGDELTYIITSKIIALTGSDSSGTWNPWSIFAFRYPTDYPQAEVTYALLTPIVTFLPLTLVNIKLLFSALSIANVFLVWCIALKLFTPRVAIIAAFVAALNPWSIFLCRTAYEMNPEVFFYLLSITVLLFTKGWSILWSIPTFFLAFYSHIASKTIFLPFIVFSCVLAYFIHNKQFIKQYLIVAFAGVLLMSFFAFTIFGQTSSRLSELISPNAPAIATTVDALRKATIQNPLSSLISNKYSVVTFIVIQKLFATLSPAYLFSNGDQFFGLFDHGLFYVVDALFLVVGLFFLFRDRNKIGLFLVIMLLLTIVPHLLHSIKLDNFTPQISLFFPFAILVIAYGLDWMMFRNRFSSWGLRIGTIGVYTLFVCMFVNNYFFQFPLRESFDFRMRVLSRYITLSGSDPITIYTTSPEDIFSKYIFYTDAINKNTVNTIVKAMETKKYSVGNVTFDTCPMEIDPRSKTVTNVGCTPLGSERPDAVISRLSDAGATYKIFNDDVCNDFTLTPYATDITLSDFSVEKLTTERFCRQYIHTP